MAPTRLGRVQSEDIQVQVVAGDADGDAGPALGQGQLVASDLVVLVLDDRASAPALPLHVLVPVAAGGDRGEHINVAEIEEAPDGVPCVGLRLERAASVTITGEPTPPEALRPSLEKLGGERLDDRGGSLSSIAGGLLGGREAAGRDPWWCRMFPRWCR